MNSRSGRCMDRLVALFLIMGGSVLVIGSALAERPPEDNGGNSHVEAQSSATSVSAAAATAVGGAGGIANAIGMGGSGGDAAANQMQTAQGGAGGGGGDATNLGNAQNISISSRYEQKRQAPSVFAPAVYASGPCAYGWSAGASGPGAGLSFGRAKPDQNCDRRELARVLTPLNPHLALKLLCADPLIRDLYREDPQAETIDCTYIVPPTVYLDDEPKEPALDPRYATKQELDRAFKNGLLK